MNVNDNILEVKGLCVSFDGRKVVDDVSYTLRRGQTLGIVGESGSGKSVSTLAIMGLLPDKKHCQVEGSIRFFDSIDKAVEIVGMDENGMRRLRGKHVSMIFQEPMTSLNPVQKCGEQVVEMLRQHEEVDYQEARDRTIDLFK